SLARELERLRALNAVAGKPSFDCATARRPVEKAICANPELANLDREINAVNTKMVREAASDTPRAGRFYQPPQCGVRKGGLRSAQGDESAAAAAGGGRRTLVDATAVCPHSP